MRGSRATYYPLLPAAWCHVRSPGAMYDKLAEVVEIDDCSYGPPEKNFNLTACGPVDGNEGGSYLTMLSREGFIFGIINIVGNFGTVFVDQSYWQSAIAAKPQSSHKGCVRPVLVG